MDAEEFFRLVQVIWQPFAGSNRIIPLCTPVPGQPRAIVIGTNHSDFADQDTEADRIADAFANAVPIEHTYLDHDHTFARGLRRVCELAGLAIDGTWVGTNRCAVQTGPTGIAPLKANPAFNRCQDDMDELLRRFIREISPTNVILAGKYAAGWFFDENSFSNMNADWMPTEEGRTLVMAMQHPSRATFWRQAAVRLQGTFIQDPKAGPYAQYRV